MAHLSENVKKKKKNSLKMCETVKSYEKAKKTSQLRSLSLEKSSIKIILCVAVYFWLIILVHFAKK